MKTSTTTLIFTVLAMTGCTLGATDVNLGNHPQAPTDPSDGLPTPPPGLMPDDPMAPPRCDLGKQYTGFAGTMLEAGRIDNDLGVERSQVKPYSALTGEYKRVLGSSPALIGTSATTFGLDPDRWMTPPISSAVTVYSAYRVAFQGCLTYTATPTKYKTAPSNSTADTECRAWARTFWSRDANDAEAAACVQVAMVDTLKEGTNTTVAPARRWAYACAAVLSAAGFMTY